jgi:hypothetical protein
MNQINLRPFFEMVNEFSQKIPTNFVLSTTLRPKLIREEWEETKAELANIDLPKSVLIKEVCDLIYVATGGFITLGYNQNIVSLKATGEKSLIHIENSIEKGVKLFEASPDIMHLFKVFNNSLFLALKFVTYDELLQAFTLVHESNMSKFKGAKYDKYGKISKSKSYKKPDLTFLDITEPSNDTDKN